ncbi:MAG: hypothetical protein ACTTIC_08535 [Helicobacteraceae bacterium]
MDFYGFAKKILLSLNPEITKKIITKLLPKLAYCPFVTGFFVRNFIHYSSALKQNIINRDFFVPVGLRSSYDTNADMAAFFPYLGVSFTRLSVPCDENFTSLSRTVANLKKVHPATTVIGINITGSSASGGSNTSTGSSASESSAPNDALSKTYLAVAKELSPYADFLSLSAQDLGTSELKNLAQQIKQLPGAGASTIFLRLAGVRDLDTAEDLINSGLLSGLIIEAGGEQNYADFFKNAAQRFGTRAVLIASVDTQDAKLAYELIQSGAALIEFSDEMLADNPSAAKKLCLDLESLLKNDGYTLEQARKR